jgi:hypothetical protein
MSFDSTTTAGTTTTGTTTAGTSTAGSTTPITMCTPSTDISTIAHYPSPVTLSLVTLSHLSGDCFSNRPVGSLQQAVEIAAQELSPHIHANSMFQSYDLVGDITSGANTQVAWLSNFAENNLDWKKLKDTQHNNFLKAINSSGRVREMIKQHHSAKQRKTWATKKFGDLWQLDSNLKETLSDSSENMNCMRLT